MRIRVIDVESTGDSPGDGDGLVEIGYADVVARGTDLAGLPTDWYVAEGTSRLCNPGCPIPPETAQVHHLMDSDVTAEPDWKSTMRSLISQSRAADVIAWAGHGFKFEEIWMHPDWLGETPLPAICTFKSALRVWTDAPLHSNMGLRYWRNPEGIERHKALPAHRAGPDSYVTAFLLRDLLNGDNVHPACAMEQMIAWSKIPALLLRCRLGKFRNNGNGTPWEEVDDGFLAWIIGKNDFDDEDIVFTAKHHAALRRDASKLAAERRELNRQLRENGLPEEPSLDTPTIAPPPADPRQGSLAL